MTNTDCDGRTPLRYFTKEEKVSTTYAEQELYASLSQFTRLIRDTNLSLSSSITRISFQKTHFVPKQTKNSQCSCKQNYADIIGFLENIVFHFLTLTPSSDVKDDRCRLTLLKR